MINVGCLAPSLLLLSCHFLFVQQEHYMHQSLRRHSRRLMSADTLDGERIGAMNAEHAALSAAGREAACQISAPVFSISACLCLVHVCCHFTLYSFDVFGCAPHLLSRLYVALMCLRNRPSYFYSLHQPIKY